MKKKLRSILALLMAILMVAACTACGSGGNGGTASGSSKLQEVLDRGYLIVGTGSTNAPWHFYDDNGNLCGFDVSMAKIVANSLFGDPEKVKFVEQSSDERVPNLVNGNVDICFQFMTISAERAQQIEFTIPYYTEGCEALLHTNSKYKTGEQLLAAMDSGTKVTVAILQNSFAEDIVADVFAGHDNYTVDQRIRRCFTRRWPPAAAMSPCVTCPTPSIRLPLTATTSPPASPAARRTTVPASRRATRSGSTMSTPCCRTP